MHCEEIIFWTLNFKGFFVIWQTHIWTFLNTMYIHIKLLMLL